MHPTNRHMRAFAISTSVEPRRAGNWAPVPHCRVAGFGRGSDLLPGHRQRHRHPRAKDQRRDRPHRHVGVVPDGAFSLDRTDQPVQRGRSGAAHRRSGIDFRNRPAHEERVLLARQPGRADSSAVQPDVVPGDRSLEGHDLRRTEPHLVRVGQLHAVRARTRLANQLQGRVGAVYRRPEPRQRLQDEVRSVLERYDAGAREPHRQPALLQELGRGVRSRERLRGLPHAVSQPDADDHQHGAARARLPSARRHGLGAGSRFQQPPCPGDQQRKQPRRLRDLSIDRGQHHASAAQ